MGYGAGDSDETYPRSKKISSGESILGDIFIELVDGALDMALQVDDSGGSGLSRLISSGRFDLRYQNAEGEVDAPGWEVLTSGSFLSLRAESDQYRESTGDKLRFSRFGLGLITPDELPLRLGVVWGSYRVDGQSQSHGVYWELPMQYVFNDEWLLDASYARATINSKQIDDSHLDISYSFNKRFAASVGYRNISLNREHIKGVRGGLSLFW